MLLLFDAGAPPTKPLIDAAALSHVARDASIVLIGVVIAGVGNAVSRAGVERRMPRRERSVPPGVAPSSQRATAPLPGIVVGGLLPTIAAEADAPAGGYTVFKVLIVVALALASACLLALVYLHRAVLFASPDATIRVCLTIAFMLGGILTEIGVSFVNAGRKMSTMRRSEIVLPLCFSFVVFYGLWSRVAGTPDNLTACYTSFVSGLAWRRVVSTLQSTSKPTPNGPSTPRGPTS